MDERAITLERAEKFLSDVYWTDCNLFGRLWPKQRPLSELAVLSLEPSDPLVTAGEDAWPAITAQDFAPTRLGESFGPSWTTHWFRLRGSVPQEWSGSEVYLRWDSGSEALVWSEDGMPLQGLTGGNGHDARHEYLLLPKCAGGEEFTLYVEMACNGMFGVGNGGMIQPPDPDRRFALAAAELAVLDREAWELYWDLRVTYALAKQLAADSARGALAYRALRRVMGVVDAANRATWPAARHELRDFLAASNGTAAHRVVAVGHCHIDTAWLWPFRETRRKVARSWSTALALMDSHPDYVFVASQAQQFAWLKRDYPRLFARVKKAVAAGRLVPVGGTWIEMDANLPSGESMARQFLLGQRFFQEEFGRPCREFWLPDTFGYAAQLPQLMRCAGIDVFLTQKLSWNLINKFPRSTFVWEGLDGSQVGVHFPPADTYNAAADVAAALKTCQNNKDKDRLNSSLMLYGHGDGGGGPDRKMLAQLSRMRDTEGLPRTELVHPDSFFDELRAAMASGALHKWRGELYFELHQGTFTSQAAVKAMNRVAEQRLQQAEAVAAVAHALALWQGVEGEACFEYPHDELTEAWQQVLLCQFHDVLPGSSIGEVYVDSKRLQGAAICTATGVRDRAAAALALSAHASQASPAATGALEAPVAAHAAEHATMLVAWNTLGHERKDELVRVPSHLVAAFTADAAPAPVHQVLEDGSVLALASAPAMGYSARFASSELRLQGATAETMPDGGALLDNGCLRAVLSAQGTLVSLQDLTQSPPREVVPAGRHGNELALHEDVPFYWDAWDVFPYHLDKYATVNGPPDGAPLGSAVPEGAPQPSVRVIEWGPLRAAVELRWPRVGAGSSIRQVVSLAAGARMLEFETDVEWRESHRMLKARFPLDIHADEACYISEPRPPASRAPSREMQFGHVRRPAHTNTSWDWAKFEVCGHRWVDVGEEGYGVALLNDGKYGHTCRDGVLMLSLLRSPKAPDRDCDMGTHSFRYALMPHAEHFTRARVVEAAAAYNSPMFFAALPPGSTLPLTAPTRSFFSLRWLERAARGVVLQTVKRAEGRRDALVLRLYESWGGRGSVVVTSAFPIAAAWASNLLEEEGEALEVAAGSAVQLAFTPFQVRTVLLRLQTGL